MMFVSLSLTYFRELIFYRKLKVCAFNVLSRFSHVRLHVTLRTVAPQAPLSVGFSRQEYWSGLPFPPPVDLSDPGLKQVSPAVLH